MSVRRHGKGWQARIRNAGGPVERTFGTRADAIEFERRVRTRLQDSRVGRPSQYTLEEALERWVTGEAASLRSARDLQNKVRSLIPFVEGRALVDVADAAEEAKRKWLADELTPATINRRLAILRRVANLAYRQWGWLDQPVGQRVIMLPGERQRETYLTPAQVRSIAGKAKDRRVKRAILLAAMSGLRRGELLALQPENRQGDALHVPHSKSGKPRLVPLPKEARGIQVPIGLTVDELRKGWDRARAKAGMPHVRFHDLRHSYASWLVQAGAPMMAVRDLLGHASLATTSRYAHLATRDLRAAVRKGFQRVRSGSGAGRKKAA